MAPYLKKAPKNQNSSNFIKKQEALSNWTIGGAQHQKIKTDELGINGPN